MSETTSPLLQLLDARWKVFIQFIPDPTHHEPVARPKFTDAELDRVKIAARDHAAADNSDPFAYGRAMRRMRSGEWVPSEVREDAHKQTGARVANGVIIPFHQGEIA